MRARMSLVNPESLADTLDAVNDAFFYGRSLSKSQRQEAAKWIAARQGLPVSYADMFAPVADYRTNALRLFTGEARSSRAGAAHVLGEEACRALILLDVPLASVRRALARATEGMMARLGTQALETGMYCCATCSVALWRHLAVGGLTEPERCLPAGLRTLRSYRDGKGKWRRFPFYYTLLALSEMDLPRAVTEMRHVAPACERYLKRSAKDGKFSARRRDLARRVLEKC